MMQNKMLGVLGGMGPKATSVFFDRVIERTDADSDQAHVDMLIINRATMPDRTQAILTGEAGPFIHQATQDLKALEQLGACCVAIPCNTSHYFYETLSGAISVPIINMVEETVKVIVNQYGHQSRIGLLATNGTAKSGVYDAACEKYGVQLVHPDEARQQKTMDIIYDIKSGKLPEQTQPFETVAAYMLGTLKCDAMILACTELSLIPLSESLKPYCVDAMDVLVERSIEATGKSIKLK
jgi:aspartate racemase